MRRRTLVGVLVVLSLVALPAFIATCMTPPDEIPEHPGAAQQIRRLYEAKALEHGGYCVLPRIRVITESRVVSEDARHLVLDVTYFYEPFTDQDRFRGTCKQFASRTFTFLKSDGGLAIVGMSGEQR
jgi:hypothetical protein